jgi:two-component system LytT family response regulator
VIKSILVDNIKEDLFSLENMLTKEYPKIHVCETASTIKDADIFIREFSPELVFMNIQLPLNNGYNLIEYFSDADYQLIFITNEEEYPLDAINCSACGYLTKPLQKKYLEIAVNKALVRISEKHENIQNKILLDKYLRFLADNEVFGIPTIDGLEFISIKDIIYCEGLQKCTRVITKDKTDIISSYNLGEFRKILEPYGFYSPHKSYLINMKMMRKYHREGNILMINDIYIPVAKRKKKDFLNHTNHI